MLHVRQTRVLFVAVLLQGGAFQAPIAHAAPQSEPDAGSAVATQSQVDAAVQVVSRMAGDPHLRDLWAHAKAVLIVPHYREGAALVGGGSGAGMMLARTKSGWSDPVFYSVRGVSIGFQFGGASGPLAILVMSEQAVNAFEINSSTWTASRGAGLTVANSSRGARQPLGRPDLIVWTGARGLYGGLSLGALDVAPNDTANHAYYHSPVAPLQILVGAVSNSAAQPLRQALETHLARGGAARPLL